MHFILLVIAICATWALTAMIQNHAEHRGLFDVPNHRSSHDEPTPTGGGWSFTILGVVAAVVAVLLFDLSSDVIWFYVLPVVVISIVGGIDDIYPLTPALRLIIQTVCSGLVLWGLYHANPDLIGNPFLLVLVVTGAILFLIWFVNLYNFMDGIDGIAGLKAVSIVVSWLVIRQVSEQPIAEAEWMISACFIGSMIGFLFRNWSPADIFMGDVGSGFIGFGLGVSLLYLASNQPSLIFAYFIPCGVFWVDATYTLIRRMMTGQKYLQAHRSHTYQILSRKWQSHSKVVRYMGIFNLCWLLPLSVCAALVPLSASIVFLLLAWAPLVYLAWRNQAGILND